MKIINHFIPVFTEQLESTVAYYESLANRSMDRTWDIPEAGLSLATVYPYVIVSGSVEAMEPARSLRAVVYVDSMTELKEELKKQNTVIVRDQYGPIGPSVFVQHPDGCFIEYVEPVKTVI
ncbi:MULTISPECIES: VOC family protein [Paenibacillus]|uniref:VOC family protein n=1 Tax=Paenibacillus xylanilyticus TaxID=248903 RepID=A0A7Y6C1Z5_9BACL|nr:VOC family protein [Paenibacillus xylanilyticus]NUU79138.1 VOC family protein [Paenibacillus xylanilyticus]